MNSEQKEEEFFKLATPNLIDKWIKRFRFLSITNSNKTFKSDNISNECSDLKKSTRFTELDNTKEFSRKIKLTRGISNIDSMKMNSTYDERRGSLQTMRQFNSLPTTVSTNLADLINSKITLPKFPQDENRLKCLRETCWTKFFVEIVSAILGELDWHSLTEKIKTNMTILTYSDSSILYLSNKLFEFAGNFPEDVKQFLLDILLKCTRENQSFIYKDDQIPKCADLCGMKELLCLPIHLQCLDTNANGTLSGALVLVNPTSNVNILQYLDQFLQCCVRALYNASLFETYSSEFARNRSLLESLHELYEDQNSLEKFTMKSLYKIKELIKCDEVAVYLLESGSQRTSSFGFFCSVNSQNKFSTILDEVGSKRIAKMVCISGETFKYKKEEQLDELQETRISSMICKPIWDSSNHVIGVYQIINKADRTFSKNDEDVMEAITIFCSVGITNCCLYENLLKSNARAQVALEALSYHTTASSNEVSSIMNRPMPLFEHLMLGTHRFDDFSLSTEEMVQATIKLFTDLGIISAFSIKLETLYKWVLTVMKNYRNVAYHNWSHAFNVFQMMICFLQTKLIAQILMDIEILGLIVGCLCHDLDHRGTNNNFQIKTDSPLAQLYGSQATLEHHHINLTIMIMNSDGNNIFESLSTDQYSSLMIIIKKSILATDLTHHIQNRDLFFREAQNKECDWSNEVQRELLRDALMTSCDLAAATKQWPVARKAAFLVMEEFFQQGDVERNIYKIQPQFMMDRTRESELPDIQIQWIDSVCEPLYRHLTMIDVEFHEIYQQLLDNLSNWKQIRSKNLNNE